MPQDRQAGPGGWRSAPHAPQRWMRSSPAWVPAQKNSVSGETGGRMAGAVGAAAAGAAPAAASAEAGAAAVGGRNFSTRQSISATGSSPEYQTFFVVTNQPSPSAVRLGPDTSVSSARTLSSSPSRR